jgi:hypothetical protein
MIDRPGRKRDWELYAMVLDLYLAGNSINTIGAIFGFSKQRAFYMIKLARRQLAFRVFKNLPRPLPPPPQ